MQATSLPFIVAATAIGMDLGLIDAAASAALIGAGLLSVLHLPAHRPGAAPAQRARAERTPEPPVLERELDATEPMMVM